MAIAMGIVLTVLTLFALLCGTFIAVNDYGGNGVTPKGGVSGFAFTEFAIAILCAGGAVICFVLA